MGLDIVEMIMNVEETFGIRIEDRDAERIRTVGELHQYVLMQMGVRTSVPGCMSSHVFYRLRKAIQAECHVARNAVTPRTLLVALLPEKGIARRRRRLQVLAGLDLPWLRMPIPCVGLCCASMLILFGAAVGGVAVGMTGSLPALAIGLLATVAFATVWHWGGPVVRRLFPLHVSRECGTMRDLTRSTLALNMHRLRPADQSPAAPPETWEILRSIIADHVGCEPQRVTPDTRFIDDLGL